MIGIIVIAHGGLAEEMLKTAEFIVGRLDGCLAVSIGNERSPDALRQDIGAAIKRVDRGAGVLLLTDMFGGTPSNIALSFLEEDRLEVLSGVNLPMILKAFQLRDKGSLSVTAQAIGEYARQSINVAGTILNSPK